MNYMCDLAYSSFPPHIHTPAHSNLRTFSPPRIPTSAHAHIQLSTVFYSIACVASCVCSSFPPPHTPVGSPLSPRMVSMTEGPQSTSAGWRLSGVEGVGGKTQIRTQHPGKGQCKEEVRERLEKSSEPQMVSNAPNAAGRQDVDA